jgi:proteasome assembly chaperone 4
LDCSIKSGFICVTSARANADIERTGMISVETQYVPSPDGVQPALAVQVTRLVDSMLVWVGATALGSDEVERAPMSGHLGRDWAVGMSGSWSTSLFRSPYTDASSMAQRLGVSAPVTYTLSNTLPARRLQTQIFLSIDVPSGVDVERAVLSVINK